MIRFLKQTEIPKAGLEIIWRRPRRSNKQNAYLWGVVYERLAAGLSNHYQKHITAKMIHEICKDAFMPRYTVPGIEREVPMSTTDLTRNGNEESFQDYVLQIQEMAARKGIYIPDPGEE